MKEEKRGRLGEEGIKKEKIVQASRIKKMLQEDDHNEELPLLHSSDTILGGVFSIVAQMADWYDTVGARVWMCWNVG